MHRNITNQHGQSLLELLIAMTIFVMVVSSIMFLVLDAHTANRQGGERTKAALLTQEGMEATASIIRRGWRNLQNGTYGIDDSGGYWDFQGAFDYLENKYTREIVVEPVYRDVSGDIVTSGGTLDFDTKKVTSTTNWDFTTSRPSEIVLETYLMNWRSLKWTQTTQAEFNQGAPTDVVITANDDGEIELDQTSVTTFYSWPFDVPGNYSYNPADIEVTASHAQLLSQGLIGSGGTSNPGFDTTAVPWQYYDWDQNGDEVNVTGTRRAFGGNPGGYYRIRIPRGSNDEVGGVLEQQFQVTEDNPTVGTLNFDYRISSYSGNPVTFELFAFIDTVSGEPIPGTETWTSGPITGTTGWNPISVDITSLLAAQGDYYVKLAAWVETGGSSAGRFDVRLDNASVYWEKQSGVYPSDDPTIEPAASFTSADIMAWNSFQEASTKNGGEIYYQLSDDDGTIWQYWNGSAWAVAGAADYNTASVVNANIATFPATNQQLMFKAFLSSDGSQLVQLDTVSISYQILGSVSYFLSGTFDSETFDTGVANPVFNYIDWTADEPSGTRVEFQLRAASTEAGLGSATWVGPDGSGSSFYTSQGEFIETDPGATGVQWIQYRAYLYSDGSSTPVLRDITIDYET